VTKTLLALGFAAGFGMLYGRSANAIPADAKAVREAATARARYSPACFAFRSKGPPETWPPCRRSEIRMRPPVHTRRSVPPSCGTADCSDDDEPYAEG
jgi:hypothetical protein